MAYDDTINSGRTRLELRPEYGRTNEQVHSITRIVSRAHILLAHSFFCTNTVALPKPPGGTVPAVFAWDGYQDALELVTDVPTFLNFTAASEPSDRQPTLVVRSIPISFFGHNQCSLCRGCFLASDNGYWTLGSRPVPRKDARLFSFGFFSDYAFDEHH